MKHSKIKGPAFRANSPTTGSRGTLTLEQAARPSLVMEEKGILYGQGGWDRPRPHTDPELRGKALLGSARGHSPPGEWVRIGLGEAEPGGTKDIGQVNYDNAVKSCQTHQFSLFSHFLFP